MSSTGRSHRSVTNIQLVSCLDELSSDAERYLKHRVISKGIIEDGGSGKSLLLRTGITAGSAVVAFLCYQCFFWIIAQKSLGSALYGALGYAGVLVTAVIGAVAFVVTPVAAVLILQVIAEWLFVTARGDRAFCSQLASLQQRTADFNRRLQAIKAYEENPLAEKAGEGVAQKYAEEREEILTEQRALDDTLNQLRQARERVEALRRMTKALGASKETPRYRATQDVSDLVYAQQQALRIEDGPDAEVQDEAYARLRE